TSSALDDLPQRGRQCRIALAGYGEIDGESVKRLDHSRHMPGAGCAGGRERAVRGAGAAAEHGGDAAHQRVLDLLRADEMDVTVETAGGEDAAFTGDNVSARTDDDADVRLDVGIA